MSRLSGLIPATVKVTDSHHHEPWMLNVRLDGLTPEDEALITEAYERDAQVLLWQKKDGSRAWFWGRK